MRSSPCAADSSITRARHVRASSYVSPRMRDASMLAFAAPTGPIGVAVQDLILPRARATAVALIGVLAGVVGAGLGPVLIGAVSDLIQAMEPGSNSLRIALVAVSFPLLVTSAIYWLLARRIDAAQT